MYLAVLADLLEHPDGRNLAIDRNRDVRLELEAVHKSCVRAGVGRFEVLDDLANGFAGHLDGRLTVGQLLHEGRNENGCQLTSPRRKSFARNAVISKALYHIHRIETPRPQPSLCHASGHELVPAARYK